MSSLETTDSIESQVLSVTELTRNVRLLLENSFPSVWVQGQISNFKLHSSGHMYFSLKDEESQLTCVMFARQNSRLDFQPQEGQKVLCRGRISVYAPRGQYQLYVDQIQPQGVGELAIKFEKLKRKLSEEGLFDPEHKKPIPALPQSIGVVTSLDGAALHDILHVLEGRFIGASVLIYPVPVQGAGASEQIAQALDDLNTLEDAPEVVILARGGGSPEDLWAFNEEVLARAIYRSRIPVISAVGHQTDFTIADFVADLRAATPSAAAEIVLPEQEQLENRVEELLARADRSAGGLLDDLRQDLQNLIDHRCLRQPQAFMEPAIQRLDECCRALDSEIETVLERRQSDTHALIGKLESLGPAGILRRGFSVCTRLEDGAVVTDASSLRAGQRVRTKLYQGEFTSTVENGTLIGDGSCRRRSPKIARENRARRFWGAPPPPPPVAG